LPRTEKSGPERLLWLLPRPLKGEIGLLAGHEPMLAILIPGSIRVTTADGGKVVAETEAGGFLSMEHDTLTLVVRDAQLVS